MSLITGLANDSGKWSVKCPGCGRVIGEMTNREIGELASANILPLCFDCEPFGADFVPDVMLDSTDVWMVSIDRLCFLVELPVSNHSLMREELSFKRISWMTYFTLKTGYVGGVQSLSSSSYLHNSAVSLGDMVGMVSVETGEGEPK